MELRARSSVPALAGIVIASFAVRLAAALLRPTPSLFPDEYTYAALGRSLAETGRPLVRGNPADFPALLQPLLTAPAWLVGDVEIGYRLVQGIGSFAMSLAAVPAFLLARRLGLGRGLSLAVAALAVLVPDFLYTSFVVSEPFAYPLLLAAVAAGVSALTRPTRRAQLTFVAFAGLAAFSRVQFAVLPLVFLAATVLVGLRERGVRGALRAQRLPLAILFAPVPALILAPAFTLGQYNGGLGAVHVNLAGTLRWAALDAMLLAYACGWILVPGALLGLALAFWRPRSRAELAFAAIAMMLTVALVVEAGFLQAGLDGLDEIEERYVFYLIPLAGLCFALYASRGWPLRLPHLGLAAALVLVSVRIPLAGFAIAPRISGSPFLFAIAWLTARVGQNGEASLAVAAVVALLSAVAVGFSRLPRLATPVALGLAFSALVAVSAGAVAFNSRNAAAVREKYLPSQASWVDRSGLREVSLVQSAGDRRGDALMQLFWNRSVQRVLLLPGASRVDSFAYERIRVGGDGSLLVHGKPVSTPLLVDGYASTVRLRGARPVAAAPMRILWKPVGTPKLALYAVGRYYDGWLAAAGALYLWPEARGGQLAGRLSMRLTAPRSSEAFTLRFHGPRGQHEVVRLRPGETRRVRLRVCTDGHWYATFRSNLRGFVGLRVVSVHASPPVFTPDAEACAPKGRAATA